MTDLSDHGGVITTDFLSPQLRQRLERCPDLPRLPEVAARVLQLCREDDLDLKQVADAVALDGPLCANVLRLVNSPVMGLRQEIRSPAHAIAFLGLNAVRTLTLSCALLRDLPLSGVETTWSRSIVAAVAAREVALTLRFPAPDEAFLGALLQDIGMVVFTRLAGADYAAAVTGAGGYRPRLQAVEREMFGADHGEVGGWLLAQWGLPGPLCLVVAVSDGGGPDPAAISLHDDVRRLTTIVQFAGVLADVWVDADVGRAVGHARQEGRATLGLGAGTVEPILARTAAAVPGVASLFDLSLGAAEELAATLQHGAATLVTPALQAARHVDWAHAAVDSLPTAAAAVRPVTDRDALTGLANRARLESFLEDEFTRALASSTSLTVIAAKIDRFDPIGQGLGAAGSDHVLVGMARALDGILRARDLVARSGGEEFVLVLPETDAAGARVVAERIRQKIELAPAGAGEDGSAGSRGQAEPGLPVTASFGCATLGPARFTTALELLVAAERALGEATQAGCNRVVSDGAIASVAIPVSAGRHRR